MSKHTAPLAALLLLLLVSAASATGTCRYGNKRGFGKNRRKAKEATLEDTWPVRNNCEDAHICPLSSGCQDFPNRVRNNDCETFRTGNRSWKCVLKCNDDNVPCTPVGGTGDPHLTGFDGAKFDFHGVPDQHFTFFERTGGDAVVVRMRGVAADTAGTAKDLSFFSEVGVSAAAADGGGRARAAMHFCDAEREWQLAMSLNGKPVSSDVAAGDARGVELQQLTKTKWAMRTAEAEYVVKLMWPERAHVSHLNIHVRLLRVPTADDVFRGVLGITLSAARGLEPDQDLLPDVQPAAREAALVARFQVPALFPGVPARKR